MSYEPLERLENTEKLLEHRCREVDQLRNQLAAAQVQIQHLQMALADTEALEIGTGERLSKVQAERDELKAALKRIAVTKPAMVMNGNAKMDDPPDVKVNYNTVFIARAAIAKGEK